MLEKSPVFIAAVGTVALLLREAEALDTAGRSNARSLVIAEDEKLVLDDGAARGGAELILHVGPARFACLVVGPTVGVQILVLQDFKKTAVQLVGAGFEVDVDDRAGRAAILGVDAVRLDAHFADRFHRGPDRVGRLIQKVDGVDVVIDAVQQEVVLTVSAHAAGGETAVGRVASAGLSRKHARGKARQIGEIALPAERNIGQRLGCSSTRRPECSRSGASPSLP